MAFVASTQASGAGSVVLSVPAGVANGDQLTAYIVTDTNLTISTPSGWTALAAQTDIGAPDGQSARAFKRTAASEPASYTWNNGSTNDMVGFMVAHSGRDTTAGPAIVTTTNTTSNTPPVTMAATGVTATAGDDIVAVYFLDNTDSSATWSFAGPGGYAERNDYSPVSWASGSVYTADAVSAGATGSLSATATRTGGAGNAGWVAFVVRVPSAGGGGSSPSISGTGSATPANGSSLTITGTNFGATQGAGGVTIGGVAQAVTSWSDTSITVTVARGTNQYGASVNVVVTDSALASSSPYALTSLQPQSGWSFVNVGTPNPAPELRLSTSPDIASGDQIAWDTKSALVTVSASGEVTADAAVYSFAFEVWSTGSGWGTQGLYYPVSPQLVNGQIAAQVVNRRRRMRTVTQRLLDVRTWGGAPLISARWFADELDAVAGPPTYDVSLTESAVAADGVASSMVRVAALAESAASGDAVAATLLAIAALTEAASSGESIAVSLQRIAALSEALAAADAQAAALAAAAAQPEAASVADGVAALLAAGADLSESASAADAQSTGPVLTGTLSEAVSIADAFAAAGALLAAMVETVSGADAVASALLAGAAVGEVLAASDAQTTGPVVTASLAETVAAAEALTVAMGLVAQIVEAGSAAEALTTAATLGALLTEPAVPVDSVAAASASTYSVSVSETVSALEVLVALLSSGAFNPSTPPALRREVAGRLANLQSAARGRNTNRGTR